MNYRLFVLISTLLFLVSCSKEVQNEESIVISGKNLNSITHISYNYLYADQPPTRTYTTNYALNNNKIDFLNSSVFHYWHDDPSKNYTYHTESIFSYDVKNRLIKVDEEGYSDYDLNDKHFRTYEFDYYENDKIKSLLNKDANDVLFSKYSFVYQNNMIEEKYEYYDNGDMIFYNESIYQLDAKQRIYRQTSKGPFFENTDENSITETTQEASFNEENNVYQTFFNGSPSTEFEYTDIKIPSDLPKINLPYLGYTPYNIILAQFDGIVQSYNTNYMNNIIPLEPTNPYTTTYNNTLSKDNYPLRIEVLFNDKIRSETTYMYK